ncbi:MAG: RsmB/NOP family class I SAM-dependent RNA methyltransferase [Myxococcales bacterium]|nr:RsmB/NOP family class I SAM-dependent RNA methyltransferase [Myxococcales bacterium]
MATRLSQPAWLIERWLAEGGPAHATQVAEGYNHPAPLTIRLDGAALDREALAARLTAEGATVQPTAHAPDGLHIESAGSPFAGEAFGAGWWQAQDEASQLVVLLLDPQPGERVWDACAAPGGKARYIARRLGETGALLATDAHEAKARRLAEGFGGMKRVQVRAHDATTAPSERPFDRVLLDAPCSGLGVMRRHPEIKWRRTLEDVQARAALQARLLDAAARAVRPGGVLVYSVCTETAEEGPDQVARFLETHRDFAPETPADADVRWSALLDAGGALRLRPHLHGADGFFALRLRRKGSP